MFLSASPGEGNIMEHIEDLTILKSAAVVLTLQGAFDDRIKQLTDAKAAFDASEQITKTLDEATAIKTEAQRLSDEVDARNKKLNDDVAAFNSTVSANAAKESDLKQREVILQVGLSSLDAKTIKFNNDTKAAQDSLMAREASLSQALDKYNSDKAALEAQKLDFNNKLSALKA